MSPCMLGAGPKTLEGPNKTFEAPKTFPLCSSTAPSFCDVMFFLTCWPFPLFSFPAPCLLASSSLSL